MGLDGCGRVAPGGLRWFRGGVPFARLRTVDGRHVFTLKRPAENVLSCEEHETAVADRDQMHRAVIAMGFRPTVRIVKMRRTGALGDLAVRAELSRFVGSLGIEAEQTGQTYDVLLRGLLA